MKKYLSRTSQTNHKTKTKYTYLKPQRERRRRRKKKGRRKRWMIGEMEKKNPKKKDKWTKMTTKEKKSVDVTTMRSIKKTSKILR